MKEFCSVFDPSELSPCDAVRELRAVNCNNASAGGLRVAGRFLLSGPNESIRLALGEWYAGSILWQTDWNTA
jgi:hypothetical protein